MSLWSSSKVALLHPECGMITVLVRVAKASRMMVIFRASHDDRFHRTPERRGTKRETGDPPVDGYKAVQTHQFWLLCAGSSTNRTNTDTDGVQSCPTRQKILPPKESLIPGGRLICLVGQESQLECSPPGLGLATFYTPNRHLLGTAQCLSLPQWISSS